MGGCIFPGSDNHPEASSAVTIYKCMPVLGCFLYDIVMDTVTLLRYSRHFVDTITPKRTCTYMCIYICVFKLGGLKMHLLVKDQWGTGKLHTQHNFFYDHAYLVYNM